ncbi:hypothetical protein TL16_g08895 [Triparma laevis f. inornata]|uniref:Uncharacterized protein n=1 Tax=Triparma laevis f. inornata TaxID=1714386 RepID=A0A9W7B075_9STRA|nr:hypothetical protein TL16_g08895 [Triparma laevis f. inornata]
MLAFACPPPPPPPSSSSLQSAGSSLRDLYSKHLTSLLLGSISAPPSQFGLTLSEEKSQLPGAETPILTKELVERIGNAECRLVGGSQYHRAVREMGVVVESCSCGRVSSEEVALASGVGAVHDGPDFLRASCLIAMEKAYGSFEPILDEFRERVEFIMKRGFDAVQYMVDNTPNYNDHPNHIDVTTYKKPFGDLVKRIFVEFVEEKGREAQDYCKDDLRALTKYITWDLEERGNEALAEAIGGGGREAVEVYNLAIEESINGRKSKPTPTINAATQVQKRTKKKRKKKNSSSSSNPKPDILKEWEEANSPPSEFPPEDAGEDLTSGDLVGGLMNRASRTDVDKTSAVINALVGHLSFKWRSNFARQVATKFNCFFLLSFMDEFNEYLRLELNKVYSNTSSLSSSGNTVGSLFDLREMSTKLEDAERELERELDKLMFKKKMLEDIVNSK